MDNTIKFYWGNGKDYNGKPYDAKLTPEDIIEMQKIDADCNDCKFFKRGIMIKVPGMKHFEGECLKFDKPTKAFPLQYTGHKCFEHRRETI